MHIYVVSVLFAMFGGRPEEMIVCIFVSFCRYLRRFSPLWDVFGKAWGAACMHICVVSACLGCLWQRVG